MPPTFVHAPHLTPQLPVYVPNEDERKDPVLYAKNVRQYMLKYSKLIPTDSKFEDKLVYHRMVKVSTGPPSKRVVKQDDASSATITAKAL